MQFIEIPGLEDIKSTLIKSVTSSQIAHAQLFDGKVGGGALAMALAFATYINCENKTANDACGNCASCAKMTKLIHPDLHFIFPIAISKKIDGKTSDSFLPIWREFIKESPYRTLPEWLDTIGAENKQGNISVEEARGVLKKLSIKSYEGEYKILLIWKAEIMNPSSANAILKILEEPPEKTLFILVTDHSDRLITTIISRTQRINIPIFKDAEIQQYLSEKDVPEKQAEQITFLSDGNLSKALALLSEKQEDTSVWFADWMRACFKYDVAKLVKMADLYEDMNKEKQKATLEYALRMYRDMLIWGQGAGELLRVPAEELTFVKNFSKTVSFEAVEKMIDEINKAYLHVERNVKAKIVFLDLSLTIAPFFKLK